MNYLGSMNPYMTPAAYAEELRKRQMMLRGQTPQAPKMSPEKQPQMSMPPSNAYGLTPEQMSAIGNDTSAKEAQIRSQMEYANALRGTKSAGPRSVGNVVVNNPWEGLEVGFNRALGGYLAGKADKKLDSLDAEKDKKVQALAALEEAKYKQDRDVSLRTLGIAEDGNRRANEESIRPVVGDEDTYVDDNGKVYTGYWQENPATGKAQFLSAATGEPIDISQMRPDEMSGSGGQRIGSKNAPERFVDVDDTPYYLAWDKGAGAYIYAGGKNAGQVVDPEVFDGLERRPGLTANQLEKTIESYNDDIRPLRDLQTDMDRANEAIAALDLEEGETVFNYLDKMRGTVGDLSRAADPDLQNAHAAIATVLNTITRQRAGLSQTLAEMDNVKSETGTRSIFTDPIVFSKYWDRLQDKVASDMDFIKRNLSPEARRALDRRNGKGGNSSDSTQSDPASIQEDVSVAEEAPSPYGDRQTKRRRGPPGRSTTESPEPQINDPMGFGVDKSEYSREQKEEYVEWLRGQQR